MKLIVNKDIIGRDKNGVGRTHATIGDELNVLIQHKNYYTCDSSHYPNTAIAVFPNQASVIHEAKRIDELQLEKELEDGILFEQTE